MKTDFDIRRDTFIEPGHRPEVAQRRFQMMLIGLFAALALALLLAALGIYSVMAYLVTQRTHEIGILMALGARPRDVLKLIVRQGMLLALTGVGIGLAGSFALARVIASQLYEVGAADPTAFAGVSLLLALVGVLRMLFSSPSRGQSRSDGGAEIRINAKSGPLRDAEFILLPECPPRLSGKRRDANRRQKSDTPADRGLAPRPRC